MLEENLKQQLDICMGCGYCRDAYGDEGMSETLKTKHSEPDGPGGLEPPG